MRSASRTRSRFSTRWASEAAHCSASVGRFLRDMSQHPWRPLLQKAQDLAIEFLDGVSTRSVGRPVDFGTLLERAGGPLPTDGEDPIVVIERLTRSIDAGMVSN